YNKVPLIDNLVHYTSQMCVPDNTFRNWKAYEQKTEGITAESLFTLCDPQTNGGLLVTVKPKFKNEMEMLMQQQGLGNFANPIGRMGKKTEKIVTIV
ncbi:MAG: hypothetical protein IT235_09400, partial [Bacteroidia bacterium]|nr:hypothetical protein [Bacteroidia bacterium]